MRYKFQIDILSNRPTLAIEMPPGDIYRAMDWSFSASETIFKIYCNLGLVMEADDGVLAHVGDEIDIMFFDDPNFFDLPPNNVVGLPGHEHVLLKAFRR